jgi:hypothetical protein
MACSLLDLDVKEQDDYPEMKNTIYLDLQEKGLVKLVDGKVRMPYFFVCCFISENKTSPYSTFWTELLIDNGKYLWWQNWQVFNWKYIIFRLSLYAYLEIRSVPLKDFFVGAKMNLPIDIEIKIPQLSSLKKSKNSGSFPQKLNIGIIFNIAIQTGRRI